MGGVELHQLLKNLCANTDWKYAVFWKLKHQAQMTLTWEDAYYADRDENNRLGSNNWFNDGLKDEWYEQDLLGLAIAKMSYRVYSIGQGIVGRVAATDKHVWLSGHQLINSVCSLDEHFDGWKTQFAAGIRTIVVVAVVPYGVVQLGSLNTITEDLKLMNQIREIFFDQQTSLLASVDCSPCVTDLSTNSGSVRFQRYGNNQDKSIEKNRVDKWTKVEGFNSHRENENLISDVVIQPTPCNDQNQNLFEPTISNCQMLHNLETETDSSFKFPAGCELYEALGPGFCKQNSFNWETVTTDNLTIDNMPQETTSSGLLTQRSGSENLLEAVVASVCCSDTDDQWSVPFGQPVKICAPRSDLETSGSTCYSFECLQAFSSASVSRCSEQLERSREPVKVGKKRAKPGESGRPRPRDRQLIQDRIKELRQLVPNGGKCSIDSLLEKTIKHMLFMQCITKHADKIDKCTEYKLLHKETGVQRPPSYEQGSSWAMEVGNQLKVCPVIVENIGIDGQMLVEMVCDESVHFLEITEAIRSLGLTILKGATDAYGDKTWMCFIVEGENNRSMHRMEILWALVQILESKTKT